MSGFGRTGSFVDLLMQMAIHKETGTPIKVLGTEDDKYHVEFIGGESILIPKEEFWWADEFAKLSPEELLTAAWHRDLDAANKEILFACRLLSPSYLGADGITQSSAAAPAQSYHKE